MQNDTVNVAVSGFQQKLDSFKTKIEFQQLLAQSLTAEFESLTSEFESLKQLLGASLPNFESTLRNNESTSHGRESTLRNSDSSLHGDESTSHSRESTLRNNDSSLHGDESTSHSRESTLHNNESSLHNSESSSHNNESTSPGDGATSTAQKLASLIGRLAWESLKIYYSKPNIPSRMAEIVLALHDRKKLSVMEMRRITGVSRNSLVRDIKVLKRLGWLEFHGSRKNGYFTLTASFPGFKNPDERSDP